MYQYISPSQTAPQAACPYCNPICPCCGRPLGTPWRVPTPWIVPFWSTTAATAPPSAVVPLTVGVPGPASSAAPIGAPLGFPGTIDG